MGDLLNVAIRATVSARSETIFFTWAASSGFSPA